VSRDRRELPGDDLHGLARVRVAVAGGVEPSNAARTGERRASSSPGGTGTVARTLAHVARVGRARDRDSRDRGLADDSIACCVISATFGRAARGHGIEPTHIGRATSNRTSAASSERAVTPAAAGRITRGMPRAGKAAAVHRTEREGDERQVARSRPRSIETTRVASSMLVLTITWIPTPRLERQAERRATFSSIARCRPRLSVIEPPRSIGVDVAEHTFASVTVARRAARSRRPARRRALRAHGNHAEPGAGDRAAAGRSRRGRSPGCSRAAAARALSTRWSSNAVVV